MIVFGRSYSRFALAVTLGIAGLAALALLAAFALRDPAAAMARRAAEEGRLEIWSATDRLHVDELLDAFASRYPAIRVEYREFPATVIYQRYVADAAAGRRRADFLWSPAMDLQIKLSNDGLARRYHSPERGSIASWASWKDEAWGTTAEPIVWVYNRAQIRPEDVPVTRSELAAFVTRKPGSTAIATYDPARSAAGYLYLTQDRQASRDIWRLAQAMSKAGVRLHETTEAVLSDVSEGRATLGYNVVASYVVDAQQHKPQLAIVIPRDYTLVMSRIALIPANAPHPNAAQLFLDFVLSRSGQAILNRHGMGTVRGDVAIAGPLADTRAPVRTIRVGPALLITQDQLTRRYVLRQWHAALAGTVEQ